MKAKDLEKIIQMISNLAGEDAKNPWEKGYDGAINAVLSVLYDIKPDVVVVPQFVVDWYKENVEEVENDVDYAIWSHINTENYAINPTPFNLWVESDNNAIETLINMQYGYKVEESPKYLIKSRQGLYLESFKLNENGVTRADMVFSHREAIVFSQATKINADLIAKMIGGTVELYEEDSK